MLLVTENKKRKCRYHHDSLLFPNGKYIKIDVVNKPVRYQRNAQKEKK